MTDALNRLRRVTDLFTRGAELDLGTDPDGKPILVWISKPNSFERSEARKDGLFGKQRALMALQPDDERALAVRHEASQLSDANLVTALLVPRRMELYMLARDDVKADAEWNERMNLLERWDALIADDPEHEISEEESKRFEEVSRQYLDAVQAHLEVRIRDVRAEFDAMDREQLLDGYVEAWRQAEALDAFQNESQTTELYYALRDCRATEKKQDGTWDHTKCTHPRWCPKRSDVRPLGDEFLERARQKMQEISLTEREAGNSVAPASSSASSERPSKQAESTPSTPAEK